MNTTFIYLIVFMVIVSIFMCIGLFGMADKAQKDQEESLIEPMEKALKMGLNASYGTYKKGKKELEDKTTMVIETKHSTIKLRWYPSHYYYIMQVNRHKSEPNFRYNITCQYYDVLLDTLDKLIDKDTEENTEEREKSSEE